MNRKWIRTLFEKIAWRSIQDYSLVILGALVQALAMRLFLVPAHW